MTLLSDISKSRLVVIGDVMLDVYLVGEVKRLSPEAPVPVVWVRQKTATLGGAGNVALNLVGLGCQVNLIGVRGNDPPGQKIAAILQSNGVMDNLITDESNPTTTKTRLIAQRQQLIRLDEEELWECSESLRSQLLQKIERAIEEANVVILSDYNKGVLTRDVSQYVIKMCKMKGVSVFVDPKREAWERYQSATCITPNIAEIEQISGKKIGTDETKLVEQMRQLRDRYNFEWFLATRGADGMCLIGPDDKPVFIKSVAREVFDVSGAGDTVIATVAASVAGGIPFPRAAELSNVAAGIVVGKVGSQPIKIDELRAAWRSMESGLSYINRNKISTLDSSRLLIQTHKTMGEKIVMIHGCFDLIHPDHIHRLNYAKERGDYLIVGLYSDGHMRKFKGENRPILNQNDRAEVLSALQCVDLVVLLDEREPHLMVEILKPDIFIKGIDDLADSLIDDNFIVSRGCKLEKVPCLCGYSPTLPLDNFLKK